jgi:hypothetical protein
MKIALLQMKTDAYLRSLPAHLRLEFGVNGNPWNMLLVHGSPRKINEYLFEDRDEYDVVKAARAVEESPLPNEFADMLRNGG